MVVAFHLAISTCPWLPVPDGELEQEKPVCPIVAIFCPALTLVPGMTAKL
jgi:hypothetical protein